MPRCKRPRLSPKAWIGILPLALVFWASPFGAGVASAQSSVHSQLSLHEAIETALEHNPMLVQAVLDEKRLQGMADGTAGILAENPILSSEAGVRRDRAWMGNQTSLAARVEQPLDLLGQAGSRQRAADARVMEARARRTLVRVEIAARVHKSYLAAQTAIARRMLAQQRLGTAMQTEGVLRFRVRLGASSDIDRHMAAAETARARAEVARAKSFVARAILNLRETLNLPASADAWPSDGLVEPPKELPTAGDQEALFKQHPAVRAAEAKRSAIDMEVTRLQRELRPRLSLGLAVERPSSLERFLGLFVSIAPALWRRNQGPLAETRVEGERADYERGITLASLQRQWATLQEAQRSGREELRAVEDTLASEEAMGALVRSGWAAGKFDFLRVLLAERSLAEAKRVRLGLWAELWSNFIEMNRLMGREP